MFLYRDIDNKGFIDIITNIDNEQRNYPAYPHARKITGVSRSISGNDEQNERDSQPPSRRDMGEERLGTL